MDEFTGLLIVPKDLLWTDGTFIHLEEPGPVEDVGAENLDSHAHCDQHSGLVLSHVLNASEPQAELKAIGLGRGQIVGWEEGVLPGNEDQETHEVLED